MRTPKDKRPKWSHKCKEAKGPMAPKDGWVETAEPRCWYCGKTAPREERGKLKQ